jgi:fatty acid-binding protein DegV
LLSISSRGRAHIVTDSTVRFTTWLPRRHPVVVAPLTIRCHLDAWEEGPQDDILAAAEMFERCQGFPLAEPPSPERMAEVYGQLAHQTDQIVSIHASAHINPTVGNALAASQQFLGRCSIQVVDSQSLSGGLGLLVRPPCRRGWRRPGRVVRIVTRHGRASTWSSSSPT